jgi:hypothetical protein
VFDRAGNETIQTVLVRIVAPPKPKKPKHKTSHG